MLVCLGWLVQRSRDGKGRLIKYLGRLVRYFLFISMRCARLVELGMDDVDVSDGEGEWVNWWMASD